MIKLIAIDMDGTLLNSEKELSPANEQVLRTCIDRGIYIVPATGRTVDGLPDQVKALPGIRYAITSNGAMLEDMERREVLDRRLIPWEKTVQLLEMAEKIGTMYDPYIERRGVSEKRFMDHLEDYIGSPQIRQLVKRTRDIVPNIIEYVKTQKKPAEKINLFFGDQEKRLKAWEELKEIDGIVVSASLSNNLEINAAGATKGEALLRLAAHLGIDPGETMAFGDGGNDYTMIRDAGIGVVMANGDENLKKLADYITLSNDEDGVADAIRKLVFREM